MSKKSVVILLQLLFFSFIIFSASSCQEDKESFITNLSLPDEVILKIDETRNVTISHFPDDLPLPKLSWHTSDSKVFIVSSNGEITALNVGEAKLTVKSSDLNLTAISKVKVIPIDAEHISIKPNLATVQLGNTYQLEAIVIPENTTSKILKWASNNEKVATVNNDGLVKAVGLGVAKITASSGNIVANCEITVTPIDVTNIILSQESIKLSIGESKEVKAAVFPEDATNKLVSWTSSNEDVAKVSQEGIITAFSSGTSIIKATSGKISAFCEVYVERGIVSVNIIEPGSLSSVLTIEDKLNIISLIISGTLNEQDFLFIHEMPSLRTLDISLISNISLPDKLFENNQVIEEVVLPNELIIIPEKIFMSSNLSKCAIPTKVKTIGAYSFAGSKLSGDLTIPMSVETIERSAFSHCNYITGLKFNEGLVSIERNAFNQIEGDQINQINLTIPSTVISIGVQAFMEFHGITGNLTILGKNTQIDEGAFAHCTDFDGILEISANRVGRHAFFNCSNFNRLILNEGVSIIEDVVFQKCNKLAGSLVLPSTITEIGLGAFHSLSGLTGNLILPENLQKLSTQAFEGCIGFDRIYSKNIIPPSLEGFDIFPNYKYLGVPVGSKLNYQKAVGDKPNYVRWSNFIVIEEVDFKTVNK